MASSRLLGGLAGTLAKAGLAMAGLGYIAETSLYNVDPGHRGIIFDRFKGVLPEAKAEGTHFKIPVIQRAIIMDVRTQPRLISTVTGTRDLQEVNLQLRVLSRPKLDKLSVVYQKLGTDYQERVMPSLANEVLKAVVAQYNADQLLIQREEVSAKIRDALKTRCEDFNILLDDVSITHLNFSKEFAKAIEDKQVAEQNAERAKFIVAKAEQERLALIIRSEGDAEAAQVVADSLRKSGKGLIELRRIETALSVADVLSRNQKGNVTYLPSEGGNLLLNLPTNN